MLSDENDFFVRDYEVLYEMNLFEFHHFICNDLGYDPDSMASFFLSDSSWGRRREFTLFDMGASDDDPEAPIAMESVTVGRIIHKNHDRLIWLFDMLTDRACYLELMETEKSDTSAGYPRVAHSEGQAPGQFESGVSDGSGSIFDDAMDEFNMFEGDDAYDDDF